MRYKNSRAFAAALVVSIAGLGLVGCSVEGAAAGAGGGTSTAAGCAAKVAESNAANLKAGERNPYPTESVDGAKAKGKSFWFVGLTLSNASIASFAEGATAAAEALGAKMTVFDGKGTPGTVAQGIQNAIAAKADGIILGASGATSVAEAVRAAKAAGIPVLDGMNGLPAQPLAEGVAGQVSPDFPEAARMQVNWVLNEYGCDKTHLLTVAPFNAPQSKAYADESLAESARLCPSCVNTALDIPAAEAATKMAPAVQTALQRDPDIKAILVNSDPYVAYVQQAIAATGSKAVILGHNGTQIAAGMNGKAALAADAVYAPPVVSGWFMVDGLLRAIDKGKYSGAIVEALKDKSNWGTNPDLFAIQPIYADYSTSFKKLWGVN
jgi:ABC-type sugar transport system substrate-binding protein